MPAGETLHESLSFFTNFPRFFEAGDSCKGNAHSLCQKMWINEVKETFISYNNRGSFAKSLLESVSLSVRLVPSTIPELWGLYAVCNFHLMFKVLLTCCTKSATKARPLSDPMLAGNPNLGTISLSGHWATFDALKVGIGKASTHPKNVHIMTSREW